MTSYTGTVHLANRMLVPDGWPINSPWVSYRAPSTLQLPGREVYVCTLGSVYSDSSAALASDVTPIATHVFTYTLMTVNKAMYVDSVYLIDPNGVEVGGANYNTIQVKVAGTEAFAGTTVYGITAGEVHQLPRTVVLATRDLAIGESITMVVTGTSAGSILNKGTIVIMVCYNKVAA